MDGADIGIGWINSTGGLIFQVDRAHPIQPKVNIPSSRIDTQLETENQSWIMQPLTGLVYKVENKMGGQLFSFDVSLTHVMQWIFQSK